MSDKGCGIEKKNGMERAGIKWKEAIVWNAESLCRMVERNQGSYLKRQQVCCTVQTACVFAWPPVSRVTDTLLWGHNFAVWTEVAFLLNRGPFNMVKTLWFWPVNGPFQLILQLSNSKGDRYIKAALQTLENILGNQNSLALKRARARERENDTFFQCNWKGDRQYICLLKCHWKEKMFIFFLLATT